MDEVEQHVASFQWRVDQLLSNAVGKTERNLSK